MVSTRISRKGRQGLLWQLFYKLCGLSRTTSSASEVVGYIEGDSGVCGGSGDTHRGTCRKSVLSLDPSSQRLRAIPLLLNVLEEWGWQSLFMVSLSSRDRLSTPRRLNLCPPQMVRTTGIKGDIGGTVSDVWLGHHISSR